MVVPLIPWLHKAKQIPYENLNNLDNLSKYMDTHFAPKPTLITNDQELSKFCGFLNKNYSSDLNSVGTTCIVLIKGTRYNKLLTEIETKLVLEHPKTKIALIDGSKRRFSFENPHELTPDLFGLKAYALRNSTYYMNMINPVTSDYLNTFVSKAIGSPLRSFEGKSNETYSLLKVSSAVFKRKLKKKDDFNQDDNEDDENDNKRKKTNKKTNTKTESNENENDLDSSDETNNNSGSLKSRNRRAERIKAVKKKREEEEQKLKEKLDSTTDQTEKERLRREKMEKEAHERLYDETDHDDEYESSQNEDLNDIDDEIIEL